MQSKPLNIFLHYFFKEIDSIWNLSCHVLTLSCATIFRKEDHPTTLCLPCSAASECLLYIVHPSKLIPLHMHGLAKLLYFVAIFSPLQLYTSQFSWMVATRNFKYVTFFFPLITFIIIFNVTLHACQCPSVNSYNSSIIFTKMLRQVHCLGKLLVS